MSRRKRTHPTRCLSTRAPTIPSDETSLSPEPAVGSASEMDLDAESDLAASLDRLSQEPLYHHQDLLTCGACRKKFALADILKFIKHKVNSCSARNCNEGGRFEEPDENGLDELKSLVDGVEELEEENGISLSGEVRKQTPSIFSERSKLKMLHAKALHLVSIQQRKARQLNRRASLQTVDAHTNTINTEPPSLACFKCKQVFGSAWLLLQHAQSAHGNKVHLDAVAPAPHHGDSGAHPDAPPASISTGLPTPMDLGHPAAASLMLRLQPAERQHFSANILAAAAAAAAAAGRSGPGPAPSHAEMFSSGPAGLFGEAHLLPSAENARNSTPGGARPGSAGQGGAATQPTSSVPSLARFESNVDYYSQRLRQLAGATSPASGNARSGSPSRKNSPPNSFLTTSSSNQPNALTLTPGACDISGGPRSPTPNGQPGSPKQKECEFCRKTFRFMSNLIVHRRSHTGEKPYQCKICNHACTQASKLKRHMKTHFRAQVAGSAQLNNQLDNTTDSTQSQPDSSAHLSNAHGASSRFLSANSNGGDLDDDDDELEDEEDEDETECLDEEEEEGLEGENSRGSSVEMVAEDLSAGGPPTKRSNGSPVKTRSLNKESPVKNRSMHSLLGEIMENTGLSDIQQYTEAYKQACEENIRGQHHKGSLGSMHAMLRSASSGGRVKQERPTSSNSQISMSNVENGINNLLHARALDQASHPPLRDLVGVLGVQNNQHGLLGSAFDAHRFDPKRMKLDLGGDVRDPLYAGFWLPNVGSNPFAASLAQQLSSANDQLSAELMRSKVVSDSAFSKTSSASASNSPRPGPSLGHGHTPPLALGSRTSPSSGSLTGTPPATHRKEPGARTRNDTCEYCGKVFKNCSNLTVHRRSHTGEKPYKCELCSYACAQSSKLTRHMKTHGRLGKDVYRCRFCDMPFSVPSTLEKHMRKCVVNQNSANPVSAAAVAAAAAAVVAANSSHHHGQYSMSGMHSTASNSDERDSD